MIWRTQDGRELDVRDMTTEHIVNALKLLLKRSSDNILKAALQGKQFQTTPMISVFCAELRNRYKMKQTPPAEKEACPNCGYCSDNLQYDPMRNYEYMR